MPKTSSAVLLVSSIHSMPFSLILKTMAEPVGERLLLTCTKMRSFGRSLSVRAIIKTLLAAPTISTDPTALFTAF